MTEGLWTISGPDSEVRHALVISDPTPVGSVQRHVGIGQAKARPIGIFLLLFGAFLYLGRAILLPVLAAAVDRAHFGAAGQEPGAGGHFALDHRPLSSC